MIVAISLAQSPNFIASGPDLDSIDPESEMEEPKCACCCWGFGIKRWNSDTKKAGKIVCGVCGPNRSEVPSKTTTSPSLRPLPGREGAGGRQNKEDRLAASVLSHEWRDPGQKGGEEGEGGGGREFAFELDTAIGEDTLRAARIEQYNWLDMPYYIAVLYYSTICFWLCLTSSPPAPPARGQPRHPLSNGRDNNDCFICPCDKIYIWKASFCIDTYVQSEQIWGPAVVTSWAVKRFLYKEWS